MGNFTWFIDCTSKNAKVNIHNIITELKDNYYFDRFEDIFSDDLNYHEKIDLLYNLDKLKTIIPEYITFEHFCSAILSDCKLYGYLGNSSIECRDNNIFIDIFIKHTELPPEGAAVLMYYEGFGPVTFIFPNDRKWYTMMGYSNWNFNHYFFNLFRKNEKCHEYDKNSYEKELPQIKDFIKLFENLESNPEFFLRRGFKKDSTETFIETLRISGFTPQIITTLPKF